MKTINLNFSLVFLSLMDEQKSSEVINAFNLIEALH